MAKGTPREFESSGDIRREIKTDFHWTVGILVVIFLAVFGTVFGILFNYIRSVDEKVNGVESKLSVIDGKISSTQSASRNTPYGR